MSGLAVTDPFQLADEYTARLGRIEAAARRAAVGDLAVQLDRLLRRALAAAAVSDRAWQEFLERLRALFDGLGPRAQAALVEGMAAAWVAGLEQAATSVGLLDPLDLPPIIEDPGVDRMVAEQLAAAELMLGSNEGIVPALALARRAVTRVETAAGWHVTRQAAQATDATAGQLGLSTVWLAERDACVHCLAYQGEVAAAGGMFPGGLTFGDRPVSAQPILNPPLHPNCRCLVQLHDPADVMVITALKREARRSVVRGWSLPSESEAVRLRAADRLLRAGAGLPRTVEERAERAVRRGTFGSRRVPTGT